MCGIVGYIGDKDCKDIVVEGLQRLEYRGYDSAGFVCLNEEDNSFAFIKSVGDISQLQDDLKNFDGEGFLGLGHTRWATHGKVNQDNAHPHFDCYKRIALVHNGIIEDHKTIERNLRESGHKIISETDSEVIAHLFSELLFNHKDLKISLIKLVAKLRGAYAFAMIIKDLSEQLILVRRKSPLVFGVGKGEMFAASDFLAFSDKTNKIVFMPEESIAILGKFGFKVFDFAGNSIDIKPVLINTKLIQISKGNFESFMLKEIYEQKKTIKNTVSQFCKKGENIWKQLGIDYEQIKNLKKINLVAAGTSWHAARISQFFFETICKISATVYLASEFRYMPFFKDDDSIFIFVSQSGETADTLEALRFVHSFGSKTIALTNVITSSMVRESDGFLHMQAGPEIAVASTKAFSNQVASLFWLANRIALEKKIIKKEEMEKSNQELFYAANILENIIDVYRNEITDDFSKFYSNYNKFIFLGRNISYPFAMEAALKLKEISYIFAQCYPAGELKHGPIALIDSKTPVVVFSLLDDLIYQKIISNVQEVKARGGHLLIFAFEGQDELIDLADNVFVFPKVNPLLAPLAMTGLMQFFVYQITKQLGRPIDKPRNLAKSVTVE